MGWQPGTINAPDALSGLFLGPPASGDPTGAADTIALQAAINAVCASNNGSGGELWLPGLGYTVTNLVYPAGGGSLRLVGMGPGKTIIGVPAGASGITLDLSPGSNASDVTVENLSFHRTQTPGVGTSLRVTNQNRFRLLNCNFRYGAIGLEIVMNAGTGPSFIDKCNFQNFTAEAIHLTGSAGLGSSGAMRDVYIQQTDNTQVLTQGILIDWFTTGWVFENVQALGNFAAGQLIHTGIKYSTGVPAGFQGAFLLFTNCTTDQMDTGHGLDLTNARAIWATSNFWSVLSGALGGANTGGVNVNGGVDQWYVGDYISGMGIIFTNAPNRITLGGGTRFPQTQTGGAIVLPASNPPTNLVVDPSCFFVSSITNRLATLDAATGFAYAFGRAS